MEPYLRFVNFFVQVADNEGMKNEMSEIPDAGPFFPKTKAPDVPLPIHGNCIIHGLPKIVLEYYTLVPVLDPFHRLAHGPLKKIETLQ